MSKDSQVIARLSPAELVALMNETGIIAVHESGISDGKPVIHAALKVVNAKTGEQLPGGLPFSVVMFKGLNEPGYSNIAIGTIVPASELNVTLPRDYFNFCNQRYRFTRVFPLDESSFVIQMDLMVRDVTREHLKFSFGLWGALFTQILFELMGRGRESLINAAEAYAAVHTDFAQQIASSPAPTETVLPDAVMALQAETIVPAVADAVAGEPEAAEPVVDATDPVVDEATADASVVAEAEVPVLAETEAPVVAEAEAVVVEEAQADAPVVDAEPAAEAAAVDLEPSENGEKVADPVEGKDDEAVASDAAALSIADPLVPEVADPVVDPVVDPEANAAADEAEAKDVQPA